MAYTMPTNHGILKQILDLIIADPDYSIQITGTHKSGFETVTDFEFPFNINHQVHREATYIAFPPTYREEKLDVEALNDFINQTAPSPYPPGSSKYNPWPPATGVPSPSSLLPPKLFDLGNLEGKSVLRPPFSSVSGISISRRLENPPPTSTITTLAKRINYGGTVTSKLQHAAPEHDLIPLTGSKPPPSNTCLQLRTVFRWKPDTSPVLSNPNPRSTSSNNTLSPQQQPFTIAAWHLDIQHDMLVKRSAFVVDDEYVLFLNLPIKEVAYNLNVAYLQRERERVRVKQAAGAGEEGWEMVEDGGGAESRKGRREGGEMPVMMWGCDEGVERRIVSEDVQDEYGSSASRFDFGFE